MAHPSPVSPSLTKVGNAPVFNERFRFINPTLPPLDRVLYEYRQVYHQGLSH